METLPSAPRRETRLLDREDGPPEIHTHSGASPLAGGPSREDTPIESINNEGDAIPRPPIQTGVDPSEAS